MIVKVQVSGSHVSICNKEGTMRMSTSATAALLARMKGRSVGFFNAAVERGGGKKDWADGKGPIEYANLSTVIELGEAIADQDW